MIDTIGNAELKNKEEDLLKNMKMLRHTVADMLGSKSFLKGLKPGAQNGIIGIDGETFPVYITANTLAADGLPEITDDIYDEENYLSLLTDDDLMWYALVEHLGTKMENLWKENEELKDENNQLREDLTAADNEIEGLEESLREANKKCTEYARDIDKLEVDNKRLSERVKTLVIEKTNRPDTAEKVSDPKEDSSNTDLDLEIIRLLTRITELENENESLKKKLFSGVPTKFGEQERGTPEDKVVRMDLETALMQQQIANLNTRIAQLEEKLKSTETELTTAMNANGILKTKIAVLTDEKREAQLLAYRLTSGEMSVQFDNMKSLEHENGVLKNENIDLIQKLCQKAVDTTEKPASEIIKECVDKPDLAERLAEYAQKNNDLLERNKRLNQEMAKLRVQLNSYSGASVVNHDDMQQKITKETFAELTARINELEEENKSLNKKKEEILDYNKKLRQEITSLRINAGLSVADSVDGMQQISSILEPHEVTANDDMNYTVSLETMNEVQARIKELESINENLQEELKKKNEINDTNAESLEFYQKNCREFALKNKELETEIENLKNENADFERVAEAHLDTTAKFAEYKDKQKRLYKHFKNLAEMIEDLMELG